LGVWAILTGIMLVYGTISPKVIRVTAFMGTLIYCIRTAFAAWDNFLTIGLCAVMAFMFWLCEFDWSWITKMNISRKTRIALTVVFAGMTGCFVLLLMIMGYLTYTAEAGNSTAVYTQMLWQMSQHFTPDTTLEFGESVSHFAVHFSPIFYLYLPFYMVLPSPVTLYILQTAAVLSAVIPLSKLAKSKGLSNGMTLVVCLLFCLFPALIGGASGGFHEYALLIPLLFWLIWALEETKLWAIVTFGILCLCVRETAAVYLVALGLYRLISCGFKEENEKQKRLAVIEKQIFELEQAQPKENEFIELTELRTRLYSEEKLAESLSQALLYLEGTDDAAGAYSCVNSAIGNLTQVKTADCVELINQLNSVSETLNDTVSKLTGMLSRLEYSPELLDSTESRLDKLEKLASKCGCEPCELDKTLKLLYDEQGSLVMLDENIDSLKAEYLEQRARVTDLAQKLHNTREKAADELSVRIEENLSFLSMPNARFCIEIAPTSEQKTKFTKKGTDTVRFLLSANRGEDPKPLSKVASGGELSRIMLSFKNVLGASDSATAIFDEIDTGVSGKAASRVAHMLRSIAGSRQVLCVTHLPQIACAAQHQYRISKSTVGTRTQTMVEKLDRAGRIDDLCRLIGGEHITEATIAGAEQMLLQAENEYKD